MHERRRPVDAGIEDVVRRQAVWRQTGGLTGALGDLMIGARGIAADPEAADTRLSFVERHAAAEHDRATADLADARLGVVRGAEAERVERVAIGRAPQ